MSISSEFLIGGAQRAGRRRSGSSAETRVEMPPPIIGYRFLGLLLLVGGAFLSLGVWRVNTVFTVRDHEIETRRLQDLAQKRRDSVLAMQSRVSDLRRAEILKSAAVGALEMTDPEPRQIEVLQISALSEARWEAAARSAGFQLSQKEDSIPGKGE